MDFFSRIKSVRNPAIPDAAIRMSSRESLKRPILLRAHTSGINDLACDIRCMRTPKPSSLSKKDLFLCFSHVLITPNRRQKCVWTVSKDGIIAVWEEVPANAAASFGFQSNL
jgi:hypothetical protein